jgi:hypothetical protein
VSVIQLEEIRDQIDRILLTVNPSGVIENLQRYNLVESLLWSNCLTSCPDCLQLYNPYTTNEEPAKIIAKQMLRSYFETIDFTNVDWKDKVFRRLQQLGKVIVACSYDDIDLCRTQIMELIQQPIEMGFELLYPYIEKINHSGDSWYFELRIREVLHA